MEIESVLFAEGFEGIGLTTIELGLFTARYFGGVGADVIKVELPSDALFCYARSARSESTGTGGTGHVTTIATKCSNAGFEAYGR